VTAPARLAARLATAALIAAPMATLVPSSTAQAAEPGECAPPATTVHRELPWPQQRLAPQRAWELTRGGSTVVAVVDTGVSAAAPALDGVVLPGIDVVSGGTADTDCSGHGTFVAGLLAAQPMPGVQFAGVAPDVRILPVRATDTADAVDPQALADGIRAAVDNDAKVIAAPLGTAEDTFAVRDAVTHAVDNDVLVIAATATASATEGAALDTGTAATPASYPGSLPGVVAVAGIGPNGEPARSEPPTTKPTLVAPGAGLISIAPEGDGHVTADGGAVAVAFVATAAALVRSYHPDLTADHPSQRLPDPLLGAGVIDPVAALTTALPAETGEQPPPLPTERLQVPVITPTDPRPTRRALAISVAVAGGAALCGLVVVVIARGRRREWKPANGRAPGAEPARNAARAA